MFSFPCPACGKSLKVKEEQAGKKGKCPNCQLPVPIPASVPAGAGTMAPRLKKAAGDVAEARTLLPPGPGGGVGETLGPPSAQDSIAGGSPTHGVATAGNISPEYFDFLAPAQENDELGRLGTYRVLKVLGAGGMGVVFQAEDPHLKRPVALKAMLPVLAVSPSNRQRFLREAQSAAAIEHDHIVHIYQVGEDRGVPFLAMQFLRGETLEDRLKRDQKLPVPEILRIGRETAMGLAAAQEKGLIHRDIKPGNIWLEERSYENQWRVKLLDFGLARTASDNSQLTQSGAILGTPAYMAPEQAAGKLVDARCDLFSLGCVLYRMGTGELPFNGADTISTLMALATEEPRPPGELNPYIPPVLSELVMQLLAKKPENRPASAVVVVEALGAIERDLAAGNEAVWIPTVHPIGTPSAPTDISNPGAKRDVTEVNARRQRRKPKKPAWQTWPYLTGAAGVAGLLFLVMFVLLGRKQSGTLVLEKDPPGASVLIDGQAVALNSPDQEGKFAIPLSRGNHVLQVSQEGYQTVTQDFTLTSGKTESLQVHLMRNRGNASPTNPSARFPIVQGQSPQASTGLSLNAVKVLEGHQGLVNRILFLPGGNRALSAGADGTMRLWDLTTGTTTFTFEGNHSFTWGLDLSPDGTRALSGCDDQNMRLWDLKTHKEIRSFLHPAMVRAVAFSPDGRPRGLTGSSDRVVRLWDLESGQLLRTFEGHTDEVFHVAISPDGHLGLSSGRNDRTVRLWDLETGKELFHMEGHTGTVWNVLFTPDGRQAISLSDDQTLRWWDVATGQQVRSFSISGRPSSLCGHLALSIKDQIWILWNVEKGTELARLEGNIYSPVTSTISPDGRFALTADWNRTLQLWKLPEAEPGK